MLLTFNDDVLQLQQHGWVLLNHLMQLGTELLQLCHVDLALELLDTHLWLFLIGLSRERSHTLALRQSPRCIKKHAPLLQSDLPQHNHVY